MQAIYIDTFAGRDPGRGLAKRYVDLSPSRFRQASYQVGLHVLSPLAQTVITFDTHPT